jgi:hypothetical protein
MGRPEGGGEQRMARLNYNYSPDLDREDICHVEFMFKLFLPPLLCFKKIVIILVIRCKQAEAQLFIIIALHVIVRWLDGGESGGGEDERKASSDPSRAPASHYTFQRH